MSLDPAPHNPASSREPERNLVPASSTELSSADIPRSISVHDLRNKLKETIESFRAGLITIISLFPESQRGELTNAAGRVAQGFLACYELRIDQIALLQAGKWEIAPQQLLSSYIDLMNDQYAAVVRPANIELTRFTDLVQSMYSANEKKTLSSAKESEKQARARLEGIQKAIESGMAEAKQKLGAALTLVRAPYNRIETELVERFQIGPHMDETAAYLKGFRKIQVATFEMARAFAKGERNIGAAAAPSPTVRLSNGSSMGKSMTGSSEGILQLRRSLGLELLEKLAAELHTALNAHSFSSEERQSVEAAFAQGAVGIQNLSFVPDPHREVAAAWREAFLRQVKLALSIISDPQRREAVSPVFSAQAQALGIFRSKE